MTQKPSIGSSSASAPWTCWARHIKSLDGFVFFRLSYFDYRELQLFAILIFEVDFSETHLMTSAENSINWSLQIWKFSGREYPHTPLQGSCLQHSQWCPSHYKKPSYHSVYISKHNQPFKQLGLVKSVCETAPKSLFWAPTCVPGFWVWPWFSFKKAIVD